MKKHLQNGILCMLASGLFFAIMGGLVKFVLREVTVTEAVFVRSAISFILLFAMARVRKVSLLGNRPWLLLARGLAGFSALSLNFYAIGKIPLGDAAILNQTSPIFVALFSVWLLGEAFSPKTLLLSLCSLVGVALIVKPSFSNMNLASWAGLSSGFLAALAYISIRELHESDSSLTMALYFAGISSLLSFPFVVLHPTLPNLWTSLALMAVGIAGTFGQLFITLAYKYEETALVAPFAYSTVLFSFGLGMLFFGEIPDMASGLGTAIVIGSCVALVRMKQKQVAMP